MSLPVKCACCFMEYLCTSGRKRAALLNVVCCALCWQTLSCSVKQAPRTLKKTQKLTAWCLCHCLVVVGSNIFCLGVLVSVGMTVLRQGPVGFADTGPSLSGLIPLVVVYLSSSPAAHILFLCWHCNEQLATLFLICSNYILSDLVIYVLIMLCVE